MKERGKSNTYFRVAYCLSEHGTLGGLIRNIEQSFLAPGGNSKRYHPVTKHLDAKGTS